MKQKNYIPLLCLFILLLSSCIGNNKNCTNSMVQEIERIIYYTAEEMRAEPVFSDPQVLRSPAKVFWLDPYIFLTDKEGGIHIIDNTNSQKLEPIAYIQIEGNWDVAVKGNYLYADSYADLLVIDIANPKAPKLVHRMNNIWDWDDIITRFREADELDILIKDKYMETYTYSVPCDADAVIAMNNTATTISNTGLSGSLARFNISGEYLYAIDSRHLQVFNLETPEQPISVGKQLVDEKIETIFTYGNRLFIGGMMGVYIYDKTDPLNLTYLDQFKHIESCDPVYVDKDYAYVTLRIDANCRNADNKLLVLDVKDFAKAKIIADYDMQHPHGLGVKDDKLYLAEGEYGWKIFDVKDKTTIDQHMIAADSSIWVTDIIPHLYKNLLLLVGKNGLFQYDITNPKQPRRLHQWQSFSNK